MKNVRVRFAPSPTGPLHIGGVRTALFNYLFAKKHGGTFILRIEDTDQNRFVEGAEQYIIKSLNWLGIAPDESVDNKGEYGPYRQSERTEIYRNEIERLIESGHAYYAFDTPEDLQKLRQAAEAKGDTFSYNIHTRKELNNSLNLSPEDLQKRLANGEPYVIRLKVPEHGAVLAHDLIRDEVKVETENLDDKVLFKADGLPTYHFANVVDDHYMEISHVIRGEEWLPSLPTHLLLYEALGWEPPKFAHLPLILKPTGKGKLSKRDGDAGGFPVFPLGWEVNETHFLGFNEIGFLPEAVLNFLALLGWHPEGNQEYFTFNELIQEFDLERVNKAGARYDFDKALAINQHYLQSLSESGAFDAYNRYLNDNGIEPMKEDQGALKLYQQRVQTFEQIRQEADFLFNAPSDYPEKPLKKFVKDNSLEILKKLKEAFESVEVFTTAEIEKSIHDFMQETGFGFGQFMPLLRLALMGKPSGPEVPQVMEVLGEIETLTRLNHFMQHLEGK